MNMTNKIYNKVIFMYKKYITFLSISSKVNYLIYIQILKFFFHFL